MPLSPGTTGVLTPEGCFVGRGFNRDIKLPERWRLSCRLRPDAFCREAAEGFEFAFVGALLAAPVASRLCKDTVSTVPFSASVAGVLTPEGCFVGRGFNRDIKLPAPTSALAAEVRSSRSAC